MKPSPDIILRFVTIVAAGGHVHLCAISNSRTEKPKGLWSNDLDELVDFATKWNTKRWNLYWTVNPLMRDPGPKPKESDVMEMRWIHVDVDPREREDVDQEQQRILDLLQSQEPKPTLIIFSGGGYQAFWRLEQPIAINGRDDLIADAKRYNKQMVNMLQADACQNVDRLMRLPGTVNWPSEKKIKKGRVPALADIVDFTDESHEIGRFMKAPDVQDNRTFANDSQDVKISSNVQRLDNLDGLRGKVNDQCISVIAHGHDPDDPGRFSSRSDAVWYATCEMVRGEIDDDTIYAVLTDKDWGISAHVFDQGNPEEYAIRQIGRAHQFAVDPDLMALNDEYAKVRVGGKTRVLREYLQHGDTYTTVEYSTIQDFKSFFSHRLKMIKDADGNDKAIRMGDWWLNNEKVRVFDYVCFRPGLESPGGYNLWRGFAYKAIPGDCSPFLDHIRNNICRGKQEWYDYLVGWMAHAVQRPHEPGHVAIVFQGKQGTGKGFFANQFGKLFGRHYLPVRDSNHIFGQFNGHLQDCVLLFADESFWVGGKKQASMLKALITEPEIMVERKTIDAIKSQNCVHLIMASNEEHIVAKEDNDRRFFVLEVGDEHMQDGEYFKEIAEKMENGGYEALLHYLLNYDISDFNVRAFPETEAARAQQDYTRTGQDAWWYEKLCEGEVFDHTEGWPEYVFRDELMVDLHEYMQTYNRGSIVPNKRALGHFIRKLLPVQDVQKARGEHLVRISIDQSVKKRNPPIYQLGTLEECRRLWEEHKCQGKKLDWPTATEVDLSDHQPTVSKEPF